MSFSYLLHGVPKGNDYFKRINIIAILGKKNVNLVFCYHGTSFEGLIFLRIIISMNIFFFGLQIHLHVKKEKY